MINVPVLFRKQQKKEIFTKKRKFLKRFRKISSPYFV